MLTKKEKRDVYIFLHFCLCKINIPNLELLALKCSFSGIIAASIMGKLASNPGMFWILCASHKQFNLLASVVKKRMRKP